MRKKPAHIILIHLLAVSVGTGAGWLARPGSSSVAEDGCRVKDPTQNSAPILPAEALLNTALAEAGALQPEPRPRAERLDDLWKNEAESDPQAGFTEAMGRLEALLDSADPDAEKIDEWLLKMTASFARWLAKDPDAAIAALDASTGSAADHFRNEGGFSDALGKVIDEIGLRQCLGLLAKVPDEVSMSAVLAYFGKRGDLEELKWFTATYQSPRYPFWGRAVMQETASTWPLESRDEFLTFFEGKGLATAIADFASRMEGMECIEWVRIRLADDALNEELRGVVAGSSGLRDKINALDVPFDERIALLQEFRLEPETLEHAYTAQQLIFPRLSDFFDNPSEESDWLYRYRKGAATAAETRDAAVAAFGEPGSASAEFHSQLFRFLAQEDLGRAVEVLEGLPPAQVDWEKAYASRWWFYGVEPDRFYELTLSISYQNDPVLQNFLKDSWREHAAADLNKYGEGYIEWIRNLPAGQEKQWALEGVEAASKGSFPSIHSEVTKLLENSP